MRTHAHSRTHEVAHAHMHLRHIKPRGRVLAQGFGLLSPFEAQVGGELWPFAGRLLRDDSRCGCGRGSSQR
eukprot:11074429-Alexandrium_andersonii.AAC.1